MSLHNSSDMMRRFRFFVALAALAAGAYCSLGTSTAPARLRVPRGVFIDSVATSLQVSEVVVTNYASRPVQARFLGDAGRTLSVPPGGSVRTCLVPGKYAFELKNDRRVRRRLWVKLAAGRRYLYFHR
jgi:hypothetical protein